MLLYHVKDMSCGHCAQSITQAVKGVDARAEVTIDLAAKSVAVASSAPSGRIAAAIRQAGYTPDAASAPAGSASKSGCCGRC